MYLIQIILLILSCLFYPITCEIIRISRSQRPHAERIVDGFGLKNANIEDYPYQASVYIFGEYICGASIISETELLTSAYCVYHNAEYNIRAGSAILNEGVSIAVKAIAIHSKFISGTFSSYDIAILQLVSPLVFSDCIQPIRLAERRPPTGTNVSIAGWNWVTTSCYHWQISEVLKVTTVHTIEQSICENSAADLGYAYAVTDDMICAGLEEGVKCTCSGDSGGTLVDILTGEQVGVDSLGICCCMSESLTTFASVPDIIKFNDIYEGFVFN